MMTLEAKKLSIIEQILALEEESVLDAVVKILEEASSNDNIVNEPQENYDSNKQETQPLNQKKTIRLLSDYFKDKPVKEVYLFGSIARKDHSKESDIDLYLSFPKNHKISIFGLGRMQNEIFNLTGRKSDLVIEGSEYAFVKKTLHQEKILIYGKEQAA